MVTNEEILKIKHRIVAAVDVEKLYLFGSYAYGAPNEDSDYDFYIVIPNNSDMRPIDAAVEAKLAVWDINKSMDILAGRSEKFAYRSQGLTLEKEIADRGIVLYER
jgi:predicted nucleotidyltransferase